MGGRHPAVECDNCKATGSLGGAYVQWSDGTKKLKPDVRSYFTLSKIRGTHEVEKFESLHFCSMPCVVEYFTNMGRPDW